jgi:hypothetical protein
MLAEEEARESFKSSAMITKPTKESHPPNPQNSRCAKENDSQADDRRERKKRRAKHTHPTRPQPSNQTRRTCQYDQNIKASKQPDKNAYTNGHQDDQTK